VILSNLQSVPADVAPERLRVVALLSGAPSATELWTLNALAREPIELLVVRACRPTGLSRGQRLKRLVKSIGLRRLLSRAAGNLLIARWHNRRREQELDRLFDGNSLRTWWRSSWLRVIDVPHLNHDNTSTTLASLKPDLLVRVSGGVLSKKIFTVPRLATLNIHHGMAPMIKGVWSIPWALIENRKDWIGATVHFIDEGIDTGKVIWRSQPQIAPGDTGVSLFFRAHLQAVTALCQVVRQFAADCIPETLSLPPGADGVYHTVPELPHWLRYILLRSGQDAELVLREAIEC
jgi:hypothetical protein